MHRDIAGNGSPRFGKQPCAAGRSFAINSSTRCRLCVGKCDATCWRRAGKQKAANWLRQIPSIGPIRAALLIALIQTPHRFRTKRQLWAYSGLALQTSASGEYRFVQGQRKRSKKAPGIRGLNLNHNHDLKNIFKGAAVRAAGVPGPFQEFYTALIAKGMKPSMARLTLARKIAAITLLVWKKGVRFDAEYLKQAA
jgi:hypothetical protein